MNDKLQGQKWMEKAKENEVSAVISIETQENLKILLAKQYIAVGSIKGRMEIYHGHGKEKFFYIYPLIGNRIKCVFNDDHREQASKAVDQNVTVSGRLKYLEGDFFPTEVSVENIEIHDSDSELQTLSGLIGSVEKGDPNSTSIEKIKRIRDGWQARAALASDAEPVARKMGWIGISDNPPRLEFSMLKTELEAKGYLEHEIHQAYLAPPSAAQAVEAVQLVAKLAQQFPDCDTTLTVEQFADWLKANIHTEAAQVERDAKDAELRQQCDELLALLKIAQCPQCDGSGIVMEVRQICVPACCGKPLRTGECCGNPDPAPELIHEPAPCQWCEERKAAIAGANREG
jgi:hypothetical protein